QGFIDVASPGDTIMVSRGVYAGSLDFKGKNVTLQSIEGPASTTIAGAVQIGPAGTLKGFTITGSSSTFASGVVSIGDGSLISGNIFDGTTTVSVGTGSVIFGNGASPTIERNIFRNVTCDSQLNSGAVAFVNGSSPQIVNNVFENNACT